MIKKIYGSLVWLITTLFVVYSFCLNTAAAVFIDPIKSSLHASNMQVSLAVSAFIFGFACMQIPAGYLLDKYNARFVVASGVFILALGNTLTSFANNLTVLTVANLFQGIGASFAFTAAAVLIAQWFSAKLFPILFGLTQALSCTLSALIHYVFTVALTVHSWNLIYQKLAFFGFVLFILTILIVKNPAHALHKKTLSLKQSLTKIMTNKQILLCTFAAATSFGVLLAYASLWYLQIQKFYTVPNLQAEIISGMIFFGIGIGTPILGWISNLIKSRLMVIRISLVLGTMALLLGIYLPHYNIETLIIIKIVSFLIGFLLSGSMLFYTVVSEISADAARGVALSVTNTGVFLFNTILMFIPYLFITTISKTFFTNLWVLPFCCMFSVLLVYFIKETY